MQDLSISQYLIFAHELPRDPLGRLNYVEHQVMEAIEAMARHWLHRSSVPARNRCHYKAADARNPNCWASNPSYRTMRILLVWMCQQIAHLTICMYIRHVYIMYMYKIFVDTNARPLIFPKWRSERFWVLPYVYGRMSNIRRPCLALAVAGRPLGPLLVWNLAILIPSSKRTSDGC